MRCAWHKEYIFLNFDKSLKKWSLLETRKGCLWSRKSFSELIPKPNFIISKSKNLIEVQATAEKGSFSKKQLNTLIDLASEECDKLFNIQSEVIKQW